MTGKVSHTNSERERGGIRERGREREGEREREERERKVYERVDR